MSVVPNPRVFFDISIGGRRAGRMIFELFMDKLPYTAENFSGYIGKTNKLCAGETGLGYYLRPRWYKNTPIHRIVSGFMCQGGNFNTGNSYGGESIYGQYMRDESYSYYHSKRGVLGMCKTRYKNSNASQFYITFKPCSFLDNKMVVFGHLEYGDEVLDQIEEQGTMIGRTKKETMSRSEQRKVINKMYSGEIPQDTIYDPRINNEVRERKFIARTDIERPKFSEETYKMEQSYKNIIPEEVYKRAHYNF
ncbi:peptidyl-prolyl cis-trans isomerase [Theileria orientalis strain Shintoku]|uniref:Peptidyl-prolyl cis-trans isomerase n=1 Tax=Theileria orientalis strain Shintoku TaxID=869250 RepID=J4DNU8_THEOR|nr:peptidyl-prolyl cis-trans isomerase [Theileria orientalis strain Shintoku]PVC49608.1 peptidyl-prolyl cis-trans isomerase [Theileria orientalis]BAM39584.1 peptidyl-prolyl cis-trans isomerase [Theileria orientalis strain Shintoku]|eukprot:XP_009689885.1 peptidyl-prolyl cis-trans isomerase [Theileria orientalis strain Shintoku]